MIEQQLNIHVLGTGERTVLLGHGFGTDQSAWRHIVPWLAEKYRVVLYDLACSGSADPAMFNVSRYRALDGYVEDLLAVMQRAGVDRCAYIGHSVSSMIGLLAARREPKRFDRLIMIAPSPRYLNDGDYHGGFEMSALTEVFDAVAGNYRAWAVDFAPLVAAASVTDPAVQEFSAGLLKMRPDVALVTLMTIFRSDVRAEVAGFPIPTAIIQTRNDPAVPIIVGEWLHREIPNSTLDMVEGGGHLPHLTAPQEINRILRRYL